MAYINEAPMRIGKEDPWALTEAKAGLMAYINYAPMRIGAEDLWALTELAKAGGRSPPSLGRVWGVPPTR